MTHNTTQETEQEKQDRYDSYERAEYEEWSAEQDMRDLKDSDRITLNAVQHRANKHGFAVAMRKPPTKYIDIQRVARALDDIITSLD